MGDEVRTDASVAAAAAGRTALDSKKRTRVDADPRDLERVAEIVLVLSAMSETRGGRDPTAAERALVAEAREKLEKMCELLDHRKDLFTREMAMGVVLDHGLNLPKDNVPRPRKISIAEKVANTMKKMLEIKEFGVQSSTPSSQHLPAIIGAKPESHVFFHGAHSFLLDTSNSRAPSVGGFQTASTGIPSLASATSLLKQSQVNELQRGLFPMKSSSSLVEATNFRFDPRPIGPSYVSQIQDKSTTSVQSFPTSLTKPSQGSKLYQTSTRVEGAHGINSFQISSQVARDQDPKSTVIQPVSGNLQLTHQPSHGINVMHAASVFTQHTEIAKSVQKFLPPKPLIQPNWTPPSTDYMSTPLNCQICKIIINDVESLHVCDACEKGAHLKCLQSYNQRGIPKVEWHCPKCLMSSNGKTFAPKYGRVTRNITASRTSSNAGGVQISSEKRAENLDSKAKYQKIIPNGSTVTPNPSHASTVGINQESNTGIETPNSRELQSVEIPLTSTKENGAHKGSCTDHLDGRDVPTCISSGEPSGSSNWHCLNSGLLPCEMQLSTSDNLHSKVESDNCSSTPASNAGVEVSARIQAQSDLQTVDCKERVIYAMIYADPLREMSKPTAEELKKLSELGETSSLETVCDTMGGVLVRSGETLDSGDGARDCGRPSTAGIDGVEWVGDVL